MSDFTNNMKQESKGLFQYIFNKWKCKFIYMNELDIKPVNATGSMHIIKDSKSGPDCIFMWFLHQHINKWWNR